MKTALILVFFAAAALVHCHDEFTAEQKAELDAKIAKLSPEAQEAAKKIKGIFEANEDNKSAAMEQTKTFMGTLSEAVIAEIKSVMPPQAAPARARRQAPTPAPSPAASSAPSRVRRQAPTEQPDAAAVEDSKQQE